MVPIYIVSRDRLDPLQKQIAYLEELGLENITIVDNASTYPPLLAYLADSPHRSIMLEENIGHNCVWEIGLDLSDYFIVTDPDVVPTRDTPRDFMDVFKSFLQGNPDLLKVGFSLKIDDLPSWYKFRLEVMRWEGQFWQHSFQWDGREYYNAPVDTTFAMYQPNAPYAILPAARIGGQYCARHLSWYMNSDNLTEEEIYYAERAKRNITTWTVNELPEPIRNILNGS